MEMPTLQVTVVDEKRKVAYEVYAYRKLTEGEARGAVRMYLSQQRRQPKKNSRVKIVTIIGATDS